MHDGLWQVTHKGDSRGRALADAHYTRQTPGASMWTRPGYNFVLYHETKSGGRAVFVWWRPKWEDGRPGTSRKDGLRVLECTIFRREGDTALASDLITAAVSALSTEDAESALRLSSAGRIDGLITGVGSGATARGRSSRSKPGACFRHAGWIPMPKRVTKRSRADVWLQHPTWRLCLEGLDA